MSFVRSRAFWPGARQILCAFGLIVCLGFPAFSTEVNAQSPAAHPQAQGAAVQTIDAASLSSIVDLDGPWRFQTGDDHRFADPAFDDSAWPSIRSGQPLKAAGIPSNRGYAWARIHLRTPADARGLALAVYSAGAQQYQVFVNGSPIASTPGMASREPRIVWPFAVALPQSGDIVLAIRFYDREGFTFYSLPFTRISIGLVGAVQTSVELQSLRTINNSLLALYASLGINLLIAIIAIILFRSQPDHDEYFWLGIACLMFVLAGSFEIAGASGWLVYTSAGTLAEQYVGWLFDVANIEFFVRFTRVRRRWPIRLVQATQLAAPLVMALSNSVVSTFEGVIGLFLFAAAVAVCLISAYRRGLADSRLMLIPGVAWVLLNFAWGIALAWPAAVPWGTVFHFGHFGIEVNELGSLLLCLGIFAVVLYRFIRVARDEQRAAAELEAARTVQQILVPEEIPTIPGFSIQAVYHPAGQVGGDFYQVLPAPNGSLLAIIGDVSGKGMPAAMTVSLLVGTVRTLAHYTHDPAAILTAMNQRMIGRGSGFTTCLVLRLDPDGTLTAANAGHIAPYANGKELGIDNGLPLGITAAATYSNTTLHLEADATLTLLTDGVVEAQNAKGELFGFERAAAISSKPAQTVADAAQAFGQEDDITVLSLAWVAGG